MRRSATLDHYNSTAADDPFLALTCSMFVPVFFISIGRQANGGELGDRAMFPVVLVLVAIATKEASCGVSAASRWRQRSPARRKNPEPGT